jgi:4a-hydroxytetrahydrobiopterin dehydratase
VNKVAAIAESEGHHPVLHIYFGRAVVELWTHSINGLSENDFILAAKIDKL